MTTEVLCELQERNVHESNPEFFYHLLCKLPAASLSTVLRNQPRPPRYLVDHFFSQNPQLLMSSSRIDLETCEDSPFIPLSILLKSLQAQAQAMLADPSIQQDKHVLPYALDFAYMMQSIDFLARK